MTADTAIGVLVDQLKAAAVGMDPAPTIGMGWPTTTQLALVAKMGARFISVYDRGLAINATRWYPDPVIDTPNATGVTTQVSATTIAPGGQATLTLGGTPVANDAVSFLIAQGKTQLGYVAIQQASDTPATFALRLAGLVTSPWVSLATSNGVITVTNNTSQPIVFGSYAGNIVNRIVDGARIMRHLQVVIWASSAADRSLVAAAIMPTLIKLKVNFGAQSANGEWVRLNYVGDLFQDDDVVSKVYRRDLMVQTEYSETFPDILYSVLAPILTEQVENNIDNTLLTVT